jgi:hypothetical protein
MRKRMFIATLVALSLVATGSVAAQSVTSTSLSEPLLEAVEQFKSAGKDSQAKMFLSWGEFVTGEGETFVPVVLYLPKGSAPLNAGQNVTFFGVIQDATGATVTAFQSTEPVNASKDDLYVEETLTVPGGEHRGYFGLARDGEVLGIVSSGLKLSGNLDKEASAISPLILSNNLFPMDRPQEPTDPFAFGGVKVVPKADRTFRKSDELWYFFEMRNPGMAEAPLPADGTVPVAAVAASPRVQIKLDLEGKDTAGKPVKMTAPPREADMMEMRGVPGHYGVGSAIPLESFRAGEYTLTVKVIDTVKKASQTMTETFRVVE